MGPLLSTETVAEDCDGVKWYALTEDDKKAKMVQTMDYKNT